MKKYYSFGGQTIMRDANGLKYMLTDHLGSVVAITGSNGTLITQLRYLPFGGERTNVPSINASSTDYGYTGQRKLDSGMGGLMDYKARFYSPYINHFLQPDSLIPDPSNPQAWNRYSYVGNNPIGYSDPTGHRACGKDEAIDCNGNLTNLRAIDKDKKCGDKEPIKCLDKRRYLEEAPKKEVQTDFTDRALEGLVKVADYSKELFEALLHIENYGVPVYKQLRGLGNMTPIVEGAIGFGLQISHDAKNPNLSPIQKVGRASVIFMEYATTDLVAMAGVPFAAGFGAGLGAEITSHPAGAIVGGIAGYTIENVIVTASMDYMYWDPLNESLGITP